MGRAYLGIDAGGTSTTAVMIGEDGTLLGWGTAGPANHVTAGVEAAAGQISAAVAGAMGAAETLPVAIALGSAGLEVPGDPEDGRALLPAELADVPLRFDTDALISLEGALGGEPGIVVAAGTGSIAFGRDPMGSRAYAGGWGWRVGDEGSAYWIAAEALRTASHMADGRRAPGPLLSGLVGAVGAKDALELRDWIYASERSPGDIARLAKVVDRLASEGDPTSRSILADAASQLVDAAEAVSRGLKSVGAPIDITYTGGVFESAWVRRAFADEIQRRGWGQTVEPLLPPALGAALHAWRLGHVGHPDPGSDAALWQVPIPFGLLETLLQQVAVLDGGRVRAEE